MNAVTVFALLAALAFGLLFIVLVTPSPRGKGCCAPDNTQRLDRFRGRLNEQVGLESETYLQLLAQGLRAHTRIIAGMRCKVLAHQALVPAGPLRIRYTGPKPRRRRHVSQMPLPFHRAA